MSRKLISVCGAALLAVATLWGTVANPAWAWNPSSDPALTPTPSPSPAGAPAVDAVQAQANQPQANANEVAAPGNAPLPRSGLSNDLQPQPELAEAAGGDGAECCEDFCGLPLCSPPGRFWLRADYLMWWTNGVRLPPLVTTSPLGTPSEQAGVLGYPNTSVLYGNDTVLNEGRSGYRTTVGMWLDACHTWGVEFDYLSLGQYADGFSQSSTGNPILARPFFNLETNAQASELVAYRGLVEGSISASVSDYFQSAGATLSWNLCTCDSCCESCDPCGDDCGPPLLFCCRTDLLLGLRYYNLSDSVIVGEDLRVTEEGPLENTTFVIRDNFRAENHFYGSEVGLRTRLYRGRWSMEILTKIALGNTHRTVTIDGTTAITAPNEPTRTYDAGILAGYSNSGKYESDHFTMIPQLGLELGYQVNCNLRAYVGYNILYWCGVARAADQIDLNLDPRNFPPSTGGGLPFPQFPGDSSSFWAHGVNVGGELRF